KNKAEEFILEADHKAFDLEHRRKINFNIGRYNDAVKNGSSQFVNHELGRKRASYIKSSAIENLDKYLLEFEANFTRRGGKVLWAKNKTEAQNHLLKIFKEKKAKTTVKAKSMTTEEIHFNEFLTEHGVKTFETDLGEYI